ncbi:hypothetical protein ACO0RG_004078 [Hanseniaspora osmophila]
MPPKRKANASSKSKRTEIQEIPNKGVDNALDAKNTESKIRENRKKKLEEKDGETETNNANETIKNTKNVSVDRDQNLSLDQSIPLKRGRGRPRKSPDTVEALKSSKKHKTTKSDSITINNENEVNKDNEAVEDDDYVDAEQHSEQKKVVLRKGRGRPRKNPNDSLASKTSKSLKLSKATKTAAKNNLPKEPKMTKKRIALLAKMDDTLQNYEDVEMFYEKLHPNSINDKETAEKQMSLLGRNVLRMEKMFGLFNKEKLLSVSKILNKFDDSFLTFQNNDVLKPPEPASTTKQKNLNCFARLKKKLANNQQINNITENQFAEKFNPKDQEPRKIIFDDPNKIRSLKPGSYVDFPQFAFGNRIGKLYNTNGLVTDMVWCPEVDNGLDSKIQYLLIAKSQYNNSAIDEHLAVIRTGQPHFACIELLEINNQTQGNVEIRVIATFLHEFGELHNLKVLPVHTGNSIPLLCCTQYGTVELFNLNVEHINSQKKPLFMQLVNSVMSFKLKAEHILSFDIINQKNIIVGLESGCVAEFDLCEPDEALLLTPSYLTKIQDSHIYCVCAAHMVDETTVVATGSADGTIKAFDPKDIKNSLMTLKKSRTLSSCEIGYAPSCHAFVFSDGSGTSKIAAATTLSSASYLTMHDGYVSSVSSSKYHPFTLTGGDDGNLYICNSMKKLTVSPRTMSIFYRACRLWNWKYQKETNVYRLDGNYQVMNFAANSVTKEERTKPPGINISHCKWNETASGINIFAFVNNAGLLVVEVLS